MAEEVKSLVTSDPKTGLLERFGFQDQEDMEIEMDTFGKTGYPKPTKRFRFIYSSQSTSIEEIYFWFIDSLRHDWGVADFDKIVDIFAASEQSSFFGASQQRLGIQQDKISSLLQAIGKMVKELFQFVREMRIIDERLAIYSDSMKGESKTRESAEIALKGIWIDLVEGGSKNPGSVYGMAQQVGFTILPDLFFSVHPESIEKIDSVVDRLEFNRKVQEVLKRKLRMYLEWKRATFSELSTRRKFTLQYFRQHYDIIRMYIDWVKPYLRNVRRLGMDYARMDSADLVSSFEGSVIEIEVLARKKKPEWGQYQGCVLLHLLYRVRPHMNFQAEGYQRGPVHVGKVELTMRSYAWDGDTVERYKQMRRAEDLELVSTLDESLKVAMDSLGEELKKYLKEAGEEIFLREDAAKKKTAPSGNVFEPFVALGGAVGEMFGAFSPKGFFTSGGKANAVKVSSQKKQAMKEAETIMFKVFKNYRKAHKMVTW